MRIFVTGGTGSLGTEVISKLLKSETNEVFVYSRDEMKQRAMPKHERLVPILGCVRNRDRVIEQTRGMDLIFHFAALKCVDTLEENPEEAIATNIIGTESILGAQRINRVPRVVLSSTDKAVAPANVYGATKLVSESLVLRNKNNVVCRYGNVLGSRGSVIPLFVKTLEEKKTVYLTSAEMTRFFITISQAADFVIGCSQNSHGGLNIPKMRSCYIIDLAKAVAHSMNIQKFAFVDCGIRPGEKLHEYLELGGLSSLDAEKYSFEELCELIKPVVESVRR